MAAAALPCAMVLGNGVLGSGFATVRLVCHALFCVLAPLAILRGLRRRGVLGWTMLCLGLSGEGVYLWALRVEPRRLLVRREQLAFPRLAGLSQPLRVAVLADLQTDAIGPFERRVFAALDAERPDLVLVPGDLLQVEGVDAQGVARYPQERAALVELFRGLEHRPPLGIYMVDGDVDPSGLRMDDAGVRMLEDESVRLPGVPLQIVGLRSRSSRRGVPSELAGQVRSFAGLTLILGHAPEFALSLAARGVDVPALCVAGHTHGGQVVLPFLGPLITLSSVPRSIAAGGLFSLGDSWLCVSRGLGMERGYAPRIRLFCPPELVVLELRSGSSAGSPVPREQR